MARVAEGQARAAHALAPLVPVADAAHLARCLAEGRPVYPAVGWTRDPVWRQALDVILGHLSQEEATRPAVNELGAAPGARVEEMADGLLAGRLDSAHPAQAPLVGAALQVYWNALASRLDANLFGPGGHPSGLCPVCGSAPVASVVRIGAEQGLRYLHCSLCDAEWHLARVQCSNCSATTDIDYYALEDGGEAVKAEACAHCHSYLKQMYMTKDPEVDPVADDLASLTLDMLMAERGCLRSGPNLLFIPGQEHTAG
jgi:FdhE protein